MDEFIAWIVITAQPWFEGLVGTARVALTAKPAWGMATSTFLILVVGGYYALRYTGVIGSPFGGGDGE